MSPIKFSVVYMIVALLFFYLGIVAGRSWERKRVDRFAEVLYTTDPSKQCITIESKDGSRSVKLCAVRAETEGLGE